MENKKKTIILEGRLESTTDVGDDEDDVESCSTFSLQQCIEEFRNRRIRRNSTHLNDRTDEQQKPIAESAMKADADLIDQNRSNKENERRSKPCKNGFCYCFTSDSGDGGGCGGTPSVSTARGLNQSRYGRRARKSESSQHARADVLPSSRVKERRSAPACLKSLPTTATTTEIEPKPYKTNIVQSKFNTPRSLMAVSRLETTTHDAPLIHIIQELRDNCVVSEVRVNKHKLQQQKRQIRKPIKEDFNATRTVTRGKTMEEPKCLENIAEDTVPVSRLEVKNKSPQRKPGAGRLLQKRLSLTNMQYKPWIMTEPPPKPPRASTGSRPDSSGSSSSLTTTSPSIREAERIVDEFLIQKGVPIPKMKDSSKNVDSGLVRDHKNHNRTTHVQKHQQIILPTCPSLSDIERTINTKPPNKPHGKNIQPPKEQLVKDLSFAWKESKVSEMLKYDTNGNRKDFKSQAAQAEPQQLLGWHIPPKLQIDAVDGAVRHNLAENLETKNTPVKRQLSNCSKKDRSYPKFGWRNLSPWSTSNNAGLRKCPKSTSMFLKQSKKKILRLVTPKKNNKEIFLRARKNTPYRTVGIQTSFQDLNSYVNSSTPQSPPGSYHSGVQTNVTPQQSSTASNTVPRSQSNNPSDSSQFDFTRKVESPPKKSTRTSQRKLDFPSVCGVTSTSFAQSNRSGNDMRRNGRVYSPTNEQQKETPATRTYRSYHTDLDQDATISKMGFILSNIRARLEASDERAVQTFEEIERRETQEQGFDCPDSFGIRQRTHIDIHSYPERGYKVHEPIYSEIEEDSVHVSESPQFDNKTGIESSCSASGGVDLETLYAKVIKSPKKATSSSIPLGKFLHDSLQRTYKIPSNQLHDIPEPSVSNVSYSSPPLETSVQQSDNVSSTASLMHCQSLNNIRVMEHQSPPKQNRNLSKSDLSLHRSEIFLENLCRSELVVKGGTLERLEKVGNLQTKHDSDYISYDVPDEFGNNIDAYQDGDSSSAGGGGGDGGEDIDCSSKSISPQRFLAKPIVNSTVAQDNRVPFLRTYEPHCSSCPVTPQKTPNPNQQITQSNSQPNYLNNTIATESGAHLSGFSRYKRLKQVLQNSLRKSKNFVKSRRTSLPLCLKQPDQEQYPVEPSEMSVQTEGSCLKLDMIFALDENAPVIEQIAHAVSICRQLPELETTHEMVEAERLLLFTSLRNDTERQVKYEILTRNRMEEGHKRDFVINTMRFPGIFEANLDSFFNYYFIVTFEVAGQIYSTQSTEFRHGEVLFRHCNIGFDVKKLENEKEPCIKCNIFVLRLKKVDAHKNSSTPHRKDMQTPDILPLSATTTPNSSLSSLDGITSRFRRYGSFTFDAQIFKPFAPYDKDSDHAVKSDKLYFRAANIGNVPLKLCTQRECMEISVEIDATVLAHFPKKSYSGFLHVEDPYSLHNWNRRWCNLIGLQLEVWSDTSDMIETPLLCLNLVDNKQCLPFTACAPELCARARSFCLQCVTSKINIEMNMTTVFFAAENDTDLDEWLKHLNDTLGFIAIWMQ